MLLLSLPTVHCKSKYLTTIYIIITVLIAGWMMWCAKLLLDHQETLVNKEDICSLPKVLDINEEFQALVNRWMCTTDCPCYIGAKNQTMQMWVNYGNEVLAPSQRNADVKLLMIDGSETFPFKWTSDNNQAKHNFKQCYEEIL